MGTIAARDCLRVLELTEQVLACTLLAAVQGLRLRIQRGELQQSALSEDIASMYQDISGYFANLEEDRPLENTLRQTVEYIQNQRWTLYE